MEGVVEEVVERIVRVRMPVFFVNNSVMGVRIIGEMVHLISLVLGTIEEERMVSLENRDSSIDPITVLIF